VNQIQADMGDLYEMTTRRQIEITEGLYFFFFFNIKSI